MLDFRNSLINSTLCKVLKRRHYPLERIGNPTAQGQVWHGLDVPNRPRTLEFEPPNHWIGQFHRR